MTIGFDCLPCIAAQQKGIPKGNWNKAAKQFYAEKTFGIPKGTNESESECCAAVLQTIKSYGGRIGFFTSSWDCTIG